MRAERREETGEGENDSNWAPGRDGEQEAAHGTHRKLGKGQWARDCLGFCWWRERCPVAARQ
jgi:hypothetical protein